MTVMTGHTYRRTRFKKRTYSNQYLGPFVNHEMNRCIQCYRCVRFYQDYAGGHDFNVLACHDQVYFGRARDGILESEFSWNLIELCPTGVFTDKPLKGHYTRKWDLQTAPSVCVHCGLGCNTIPGERYGMLRRVHVRYHGEVNGYFLCDRGRFGYRFVNGEQRIKEPFFSQTAKQKAGQDPSNREMLAARLSDLLYFGARVIGIGSPRASLEANFVLRALVGPDRFCAGLPEKDLQLISLMIDILRKGPARSASLHETETCDAVLVLGEDITNTAPMLDLSLRQSVRQKPMRLSDSLKIPRWHDYAVRDALQRDTGPLFIAAPADTKLDEIAAGTFHGVPDEIARLGFAVAHEIDGESGDVKNLSPDVQTLAKKIAGSLVQAEKPLIVSGMGCGSEAVVKAAANIAWALCNKGRMAGLCFTVPECNTIGLGLIGGGSLEAAFKEVAMGRVDTAVILDNDLYRRQDKKKVDKFFERLPHAVVIDSVRTRTTSKAEVLLPSGTYAETDGTLVNNEGRAQRSFKVMQPAASVKESWRWIRDMMIVAERPEADKWKIFEDITNAISESLPLFKPLSGTAPPAGFRIAGMKVPRQPHRYSGRTSMHSNVGVHEPEPPQDPDSPLSFSMEGYEGIPPSSLIPRFWFPGWNSMQAVNKFQSEVGGPLHGGDPGVRLIEPGGNVESTYFGQMPDAFVSRTGALLILALYHIFGSEELSVLDAEIAGLAPKPYLGLGTGDTEELKVEEGEEIELVLDSAVLRLPVRRISDLAKGTAGLPAGIPGLEGIVLPAWGKVSKLNKVGGAE